jgi:hypothetical protein
MHHALRGSYDSNSATAISQQTGLSRATTLTGKELEGNDTDTKAARQKETSYLTQTMREKIRGRKKKLKRTYKISRPGSPHL